MVAGNNIARLLIPQNHVTQLATYLQFGNIVSFWH